MKDKAEDICSSYSVSGQNILDLIQCQCVHSFLCSFIRASSKESPKLLFLSANK
ncbi:hypothetical protein Gotur_013050 [Gossypium turneri]